LETLDGETARIDRRSHATALATKVFDHVLRSAASYGAKWDYVCQNPVRAGLALTPELWPYAGECVSIAF